MHGTIDYVPISINCCSHCGLGWDTSKMLTPLLVSFPNCNTGLLEFIIGEWEEIEEAIQWNVTQITTWLSCFQRKLCVKQTLFMYITAYTSDAHVFKPWFSGNSQLISVVLSAKRKKARFPHSSQYNTEIRPSVYLYPCRNYTKNNIEFN